MRLSQVADRVQGGELTAQMVDNAVLIDLLPP